MVSKIKTTLFTVLLLQSITGRAVDMDMAQFPVQKIFAVKNQTQVEELFQNLLGKLAAMTVEICESPALSAKSYCHFSQAYTIYKSANNFLASTSAGADAVLALPENPLPSDYKSLNWYMDPLAPNNKQIQIIKSFVEIEFVSHAMLLMLKDLKSTLEKFYPDQPLSFRKIQLPLAMAFLEETNPHLRTLRFVQYSKCLKQEKSCEESRSEIYSAYAEIIDRNKETFDQYQNLIENYSPQPWPEAEQIKQAFDLSELLEKIRDLNIQKVIAILDQRQDLYYEVPSLQIYIKKTQAITIEPFIISDQNRVEIYRAIYFLRRCLSFTKTKLVSNYTAQPEHLLDQKEIIKFIDKLGEFYANEEKQIQSNL